jgi:hypothetical protein
MASPKRVLRPVAWSSERMPPSLWNLSTSPLASK